jgi:hypothetical protein
MGSAFRRSLLDLQSADTEAGGAPFQDAFTIFLLKVIAASQARRTLLDLSVTNRDQGANSR